MSFPEYLDRHPERRAEIERLCDQYEAGRRDPYGSLADPEGFLRVTGRRHLGVSMWRDLAEPVIIHKADADWLQNLWAGEDFFELELWRAGISLESFEELSA